MIFHYHFHLPIAIILLLFCECQRDCNMSMTALITFEFRTMNVFNAISFKKECFLRMIFCASTFECHTSKVEIITRPKNIRVLDCEIYITGHTSVYSCINFCHFEYQEITVTKSNLQQNYFFSKIIFIQKKFCKNHSDLAIIYLSLASIFAL